MANLRLEISPMTPMTNGKSAPPNMPVHKIPENAPGWDKTELSAVENMIENIRLMQDPKAENAKADQSAGPNSATDKTVAVISTSIPKTQRASHIFKTINPTTQPMVIDPQNHATACAPLTAGSKP